MKYLMITLLFSSLTLASEVPEGLKGAKVTVTLKNGKTYTYSSESWKVVPREDKANLVSEPSVGSSCAFPVIIRKDTTENRVRVIGGVGPKGIGSTQNGSTVSVTNARKPIAGLGYERKLDDSFSVGAEALTNETYLLDVGLDF